MKTLWFRLWLGTCDEFKIEAIIEALLRQQEIFEIFVDDEVISRIFCEFYRACSALNEDRCSLVGGHTCEGKEMALGFAINGVTSIDSYGPSNSLPTLPVSPIEKRDRLFGNNDCMVKGRLRPGDLLVYVFFAT